MSQKSRPTLLSMMTCALIVSVSILIGHAFADTSIPIMTHDQREQIFSKAPSLQGTSSSNYYFAIIITPTGFQETNVVLSPLNYTALKNSVAFFTACGGFNNGLCEPPVATTAAPTTNYCPLAQMILLNQGDYISKLYNATSGKDLTGFIYPAYCYAETGPNPINGQGIPAIPEFGQTAAIVLAVIVSFAIVITHRMDLKKR